MALMWPAATEALWCADRLLLKSPTVCSGSVWTAQSSGPIDRWPADNGRWFVRWQLCVSEPPLATVKWPPPAGQELPSATGCFGSDGLPSS